jgi:hypothetical protein
MEATKKQKEYDIVYRDVITHLEHKYPSISNKWRAVPNLHILPFALIQKGCYVLRDLLEAICKDEGDCTANAIFHDNQDYLHYLIGKTRKVNTSSDAPVEYVKAEYLCQHPNKPQYLLSYVQNAIVVITIQLPTLRSIKRFVKGVKSIFGDTFWRRIDQTKIPDQHNKYTLTLKTHNRNRFANDTTNDTNNTSEDTKDTLEDTKCTLEDTKCTLEDTNNTLEDTKNTLEDTKNTLEDTKDTLEDSVV